MDLQLARQLINAGHKLPEVKDRTGVTQVGVLSDQTGD